MPRSRPEITIPKDILDKAVEDGLIQQTSCETMFEAWTRQLTGSLAQLEDSLEALDSKLRVFTVDPETIAKPEDSRAYPQFPGTSTLAYQYAALFYRILDITEFVNNLTKRVEV